MSAPRHLLALAVLALALGSCSGGGVGNPPPAPAAAAFLTEADVRRILAQAFAEAGARNVRAQVAVVDRVGNVLALYGQPSAPAGVAIDSHRSTDGGLETHAPAVPASFAAIAKAITGAYLSSNGNAFSTRTAGQIVQEHFDPDESQQPSGPLYGVQFSQLPCSDVNRNLSHGDVGPKRSPLGLAADPGGLPLYKDGVLVGGIGVEQDGVYGIDRVITDVDTSVEELIAVAGASGFAARADIRAERITADGRTFRYVDSESIASDPSRAPPLESLPAGPVSADGYASGAIRAGTAFGGVASGIRPDAGPLTARGAWVLADASGADRYPPRPGAAISAAQAAALLDEALAVANRARGQIRRPLGSFAQVTVSIVDTHGDILALARTPDAPVFGIDVAVQKARSAMFLSSPGAAADLAALPAAVYPNGETLAIGGYVDRMRDFLGDANALTGATAWSARAIGNVHRPTFPDGIEGTPPGPLSKPLADWSPFNVGLQLDLVINQVLKAVVAGDASEGCSGRRAIGAPPGGSDRGLPALRNGLQIFPGGVPIYRGDELVGAIGVSGDGVDQDDMVAYLGLENAGRRLDGAIGNAPPAMRADRLVPLGTRLRYVQCPQAPFLDSAEQNACR